MFTGLRHTSHGIDRWLASSLLVVMVSLATLYISALVALAAAVVPVYCLWRGKVAVAARDWDRYVRFHTLWHITGPIAATFVLVQVQAATKILA